MVSHLVHGAARGGLHLRLQQRRLVVARRVLRAGHDLRRLPRRLIPQVPLLGRQAVQPDRVRRLHGDVRGLRVGRTQKIT